MMTTNYISKALCIVLAIGIAVLSLSNCSLNKKLETTEGQLADKTTEYEALKTAVSFQNSQIELLAEQTVAAEERFKKAIEVAETQNKKLDKTIAQLKAREGKTCTDAMPLIDEVIRYF